MQHAATLSPVRHRARRRLPAQEPRARGAARLVSGALVMAALVVSLVSLSIQPEAPVPAAWATVSVGQSATLWTIAEAHPVEGRSTVDTVELICVENALVGGTIHAGQVLRVPAQGSAVALAQR